MRQFEQHQEFVKEISTNAGDAVIFTEVRAIFNGPHFPSRRLTDAPGPRAHSWSTRAQSAQTRAPRIRRL